MKNMCGVVFVLLMVLSGAISFGAEESTGTTMTGKFQVKAGQPMSGALLLVYSPETGAVPSMGKYWRVPDHSKSLNDEGSINTEIPEGVYYIGAILRNSGTSRIGPPEDGDFFVLSLDGKGVPKRHEVKKGEHLDIGTISGARQIKTSFFVTRTTAIEGSIQDAEGKPVEGAMAFAFLTPKVSGKPLFASERSSREGTFVLPVPEGGTYYIKIRDEFGGGPPRVGKMMDVNKEELLMKVSVETGKTARIGILKVKKFAGRGPGPGKKQDEAVVPQF